MASFRRFFARVANLLRGEARDAELSRELTSHLALFEDELQRRGMTPEDARRAARLKLGGVEQTKDRHRDARSFRWLEDARRDGRYAVRLLQRNPAMAATAVLSLAIGIGANTAVFTVANALLFRAPDAVADPGRLVDIGMSRPDGGFNPGSYLTYVDVRRRATTLAGVYAHEMFPHAMSVDSGTAGATRAFGHYVSSNYFAVLGVRPALGTFFDDSRKSGLASELRDSAGEANAVLSHRFWAQRFNADAAIVGRSVRLNGHAFTVVGVASERFQGTGVVAPDVWVPLSAARLMRTHTDRMLVDRSGGWLVMGARLAPGVTVAAAAAELDAIGQNLRREYPEQMGSRGLRLVSASSVPGNRGLVAVFFGLLMAMVSVVLIVACANVSAILLARAAARRREIAVRLSIGAGRARLVRQLLMETTVLFVLGSVAGVVLARATTSLMVASLPALPFPIAVSLPLDGRVIAFTMALSLVAALLSGLAPAMQASKVDPVSALKTDAQGLLDRSRLRHMFVTVQVAFSLALVLGAGLFVRALQRAGTADPGFDPRGVELTSLDLSTAGYTERTGPMFWRDVLERVRALPGVESTAIARSLPGGFEGIQLGLSAPGAPANPQGDDEPSGNIVAPGYFATLRIPLVEGRDFADGDRSGAQPVVIVSEAAARRYWPGERPLGKYLVQRIDDGSDGSRMLLVVGVVRDVKSTSLIDGISPSFVYLPVEQQSWLWTSSMTIVTRAAGGRRVADDVRTLVTGIDPSLPISSARTLDDWIALGLVPQRIAASVSGSLGGVGLLLAAVGIYGVTAFAVARRTRELGIRIALGATRRDVLGMVLREGMMLTFVGAAIGLVLGAGIGRLLTAFLFGLPPLDPPTFILASAIFVACGLVACYGPARRATKVDPLVALRHE
jgi:putative ABC transport system permease protein